MAAVTGGGQGHQDRQHSGHDGADHGDESGDERHHGHGNGEFGADQLQRDGDGQAFHQPEEGGAPQVAAEGPPGPGGEPGSHLLAGLGDLPAGPAQKVVAVLQGEERDDEAEQQAEGDLGGHRRPGGDLAPRGPQRVTDPLARLLTELVDIGLLDVEGAVLDQPPFQVVDALADRGAQVVELVGHRHADGGGDATEQHQEPHQPDRRRHRRRQTRTPESAHRRGQDPAEEQGHHQRKEGHPDLPDEPQGAGQCGGDDQQPPAVGRQPVDAGIDVHPATDAKRRWRRTASIVALRATPGVPLGR